MMKFGAHQTFHLRDSWIHKGLQSPSALNADSAVEDLGVGKNMVASIKYWLEALQLASQEDGEWNLTQLGDVVLENDPYIEHDGTLLLLHYLLSTNKAMATTWYWFFNKFSATEFDADSLQVYLSNYVQNNSPKAVNPNTLKKDVNCLLRMYKISKAGSKDTPENDYPCPFVRFGFLEEENRRIRKLKINRDEIDCRVFVYLLFLFWQNELSEAASVNLEELTQKDCSPGLVLGLSLEDMTELIERTVRNYPETYLGFSRTGGYNIVTFNKKKCREALKDYYRN
jgi:hypothetical protein